MVKRVADNTHPELVGSQVVTEVTDKMLPLFDYSSCFGILRAKWKLRSTFTTIMTEMAAALIERNKFWAVLDRTDVARSTATGIESNVETGHGLKCVWPQL